MHLFYTADIEKTLTLSPQESHHAVKVLRLNPGDNIQIIDGKGGYYHATITDANHKACRLQLGSKIPDKQIRPYQLHMAVAPTKNIDRFEYFIEKATEIGIDAITPLLCDHSERKVIKQERLERILVSAMKQSLKTSLPRLNPMSTFTDSMDLLQSGGNLMIAHCYDSERATIKSVLKKNTNRQITILIGPEGDFSQNEIDMAVKKGFDPITLGNSRLRKETAGIVACHSVFEYFL